MYGWLSLTIWESKGIVEGIPEDAVAVRGCVTMLTMFLRAAQRVQNRTSYRVACFHKMAYRFHDLILLFVAHLRIQGQAQTRCCHRFRDRQFAHSIAKFSI